MTANRRFISIPSFILAAALAACAEQAPQQNDAPAASVAVQAASAADGFQAASAASDSAASDAAMFDDGHNAENSLDWAGIYQGELPCADCAKNVVTLRLNDDKSYVLTTDSQGGKQPLKTEESGRFEWENGSIVKLDEKAAHARFFVAEGRVQMLEAGQNVFREDSRYNLEKQP